MTDSSENFAPWFDDISSLSGLGSALADKLAPLLGGRKIRDLLLYRPQKWVNRDLVANFDQTTPGEVQTVSGVVQTISRAPRGSKLQKVRLVDQTGFLTLVFFNSNSGFLQKQFPEGQEVVVSGLIEDFHGQRQMTHPDYVEPIGNLARIPLVEPVYPLTAGITNKRLHGFILQALALTENVSDWLDEPLKSRHRWPGFVDALNMLHKPDVFDEAALETARDRLAYDEALARAVTFQRIRAEVSRFGAPVMQSEPDSIETFISNLPFAPTGAQRRVIFEIANDLQRIEPMQRMLQGDVGAGKTTIAAYACYHAVKAGFQVAVMAPTEILARQLYSSISDLLVGSEISIECLTGGTSVTERRAILEGAENGSLNALCGTHALFQESVGFSKLGLVIIDEQHRFGVNDRAKLVQKGGIPHLLIMSATPIPRSLAMTIHGDVDLSILDEKPAGRKPVETRTIPDTRLDDIINAVGRAINKGEQVFWVCPRVEDEDGGTSAITRHAMLSDIFELPVGLVHGRLKPQDKTAALEAFRDGKTSILVATTVIEVGVDVPGATIMVIEGAERFGLAQLHQLRGRVGRGDKPSFCLLVYTPPLGVTASKRLDTLRKSEDGFHIAEVDFKLRGPGDILGLAQSGLPNFRFLDLTRHQDLLAMSQKDAVLRASRAVYSTDTTNFFLKILSPIETERPKV